MKILLIGAGILIAGVTTVVAGAILAGTAKYDCEPILWSEGCSYHWWYDIAALIGSIGGIAIFVGLIVAVIGLLLFLFRRR